MSKDINACFKSHWNFGLVNRLSEEFFENISNWDLEMALPGSLSSEIRLIASGQWIFFAVNQSLLKPTG